MVVGQVMIGTISGEIVATDVSAEDYMAHYAGDFHEWVGGTVIKMSPVSLRHDRLTHFLYTLFRAYFELKPIGEVVTAPYVMRVEVTDSRREPDLQIVLHSNPGTLTDTYMDGPADICVEVVSSDSVSRDHGEKFTEYEKGGVGEYWIIDPLRDECRFYRLDDAGRYLPQSEDAEDNYQTPTLPGLRLHVPTLWQDKLPGPAAISQLVREMIE